MNGRAIPGVYLFRLYVCDKEMSWPHHIGETHQPDWVVYVRDSEKWDTWLHKLEKRSSVNFGQIFDFSFSKETEASYWRRGDLPWINFENLEEE